MQTIKLLICYHRSAPLLNDEILTPIHVGRRGAENDSWLSENMIGDDTGENISGYNNCYNELTAVYWAWKNYDKLGSPEYIGLAHYRRHFVLDESGRGVYNIPFTTVQDYLRQLNYSPQNLTVFLTAVILSVILIRLRVMCAATSLNITGLKISSLQWILLKGFPGILRFIM